MVNFIPPKLCYEKDTIDLSKTQDRSAITQGYLKFSQRGEKEEDKGHIQLQ